ncbi:hypothetical protein CPB83DRAFT_904838 [Crepidotus variabilis]|uniref:BTB domain-containing protein n=1 Tax=Crepidotus variabilis TaxID=179855 RepID=A0A9P6EM17_9AGAR|nr:hypothetical protein CPB83DRAFT_904838 [Crepidotus variabilis]
MDGASLPTPTSSRNLKREREDEDIDGVKERSSKLPTTCIKHQVHWALDGNLLLQFGDVRFKVHRSRLVSESPYFQELINASHGNPDDDYEYKEEIDLLVNSKKVIGGLDCYYFPQDCNDDLPNAEAFSVLLDAMNTGIDYVHTPPSFATIKALLNAANSLCVTRYVTFCTNFIKMEFPSEWRSIPETSSPMAIEGVLLGSRYLVLEKILPFTYYELARRPAGATSGGFQELNTLQLRKLINLQKHLSIQWDNIATTLEVDCSKGPPLKRQVCKTCHHPSLKLFLSARNAYPLDPILGTRRLLCTDWVTKKYCDSAAVEVQERLKTCASRIWAGLQGWLDEVKDEDETDGT